MFTKVRFDTTVHFEGCVVDIVHGGRTLRSRVRVMASEYGGFVEGDEFSIDIDIGAAPEEERGDLSVGTVFDWKLGYEVDQFGTRRRGTEFKIQRWTEEEIDEWKRHMSSPEAKKRIQDWSEMFCEDDTSG